MHLLHLFLLGIFLYGIGHDCQSIDDVDIFIQENEDFVQKIGFEAGKIYKNRFEAVKNCECTYHTCTYERVFETCNVNLEPPYLCNSGCSRRVNNTMSVVNNPGNELDASKKLSICTFRTMDRFFLDFEKAAFPLAFIATIDGVFRFSPALPRDHPNEGNTPLETCRDFDPRWRPWYIAASTGTKNIVFVVDRSASMADEGGWKWRATMKAISRAIEVLDITDYLNVVTFSDGASVLLKKGLVPATPENKETILELLSKETPNGDTNLVAAYQSAFDLFYKDCSSVSGCSGCENIILFLTDAEDTRTIKGKLKPSTMLAEVRKLQKDFELTENAKRASIFTFTFGKEADDSIAKQIACHNQGTWSLIEREDDASVIVRDYYLFLAARLASENPRTVWSRIFDSDNGLGKITVVASPIYTPEEVGTARTLIAVVAKDVFVALGNKEKDFYAKIEKRRKDVGCAVASNDPCQLQLLRAQSEHASTCIDRFPVKSPKSNKTSDLQCFKHGQRFYKRSSRLVDQETAQNECVTDGGELVVVKDKEELQFVAALSSEDGSWVGARRTSDDDITWNDGSPVKKEFWANGGIGGYSGIHDCMVVDPRGPDQNLMKVKCNAMFSFICKYTSEPECKRVVKSTENEGYSVFPSPSFCSQGSNRMNEDILLEATNLDSNEVLCSLGEPLEDTEIMCCKEGYNSRAETCVNAELNSTEATVNDVKIALICLVVVLSVLLVLVIAIARWNPKAFQCCKKPIIYIPPLPSQSNPHPSGERSSSLEA